MKYLFLFSYFISVFGAMMQKSIHISQATYCNNSWNWSCKTCDSDVFLLNDIENHGERALIGMYPENKLLFVAFRGSSNIQNWIDNVQFSKICNEDNICVETGFHKVFEFMKYDVYDAIFENLEKYDIQDILFSGHSLGASISTLMVYDIYDKIDKNIHLYTFGSPRVGNEEFSRHFPIQSTRVTHANDIVVHLPQMVLGYMHINQELYYNENDRKFCDDEDPKCSNSCAPLHCVSINDHLHYLNVSMGTDGDC